VKRWWWLVVLPVALVFYALLAWYFGRVLKGIGMLGH